MRILSLRKFDILTTLPTWTCSLSRNTLIGFITWLSLVMFNILCTVAERMIDGRLTLWILEDWKRDAAPIQRSREQQGLKATHCCSSSVRCEVALPGLPHTPRAAMAQRRRNAWQGGPSCGRPMDGLRPLPPPNDRMLARRMGREASCLGAALLRRGPNAVDSLWTE